MIVKNKGSLNIPLLLFVSDGKVLKHWLEDYHSFIKNESKAELVQLACGHMMHNLCSEEITTKTKNWLTKI